MSAYLCSDDTFDYLASAAGRWARHARHIQADAGQADVPGLVAAGVLAWATAVIPLDDGATIAAILRHQNIRSLEGR